MKIKKECNLKKLYGGVVKNFKEDSPDLVFANYLATGKVDDVVGMFREKKLF